MEGIKFDKKVGTLDLVLSGKKTMFRLPSKKKSDKPFNTKYHVGQQIAILQTYKDANFEPNKEIREVTTNALVNDVITVKAKDTKGWSKISAVRADLMPHVIEITSIKTENIRDINDEDCSKEGIVQVSTNDIAMLDGNMPFDGYSLDGKTWLGDSPQEVFKNISDKVVKKNSWTTNIMVDVYEFKLIK